MMDTEAKKFLGNLWADGAPNNRQTPEDAGIEREQGWTIEYEQHGTGKYPERRVWNQLIRELQGAFQEKMLYAFPRWADDVDYPQWAWAQHDGKIWVSTQAIAAGSGEAPGTSALWRQF